MTDLAARLALKERLPRTWPAFFARHGNFTAAQLAAMPALLDGANVVVSAATASGKTAAVLAPLIERHCTSGANSLAILYLVPTRALANDLAARLAPPLDALDLALGLRTGDVATLKPSRPPAVLITTPESADALLATRARLFARLRAVVIDELHLLDGTPRGDGLRVILNRIRRIRAYAGAHGDAPDDALQYAALSATLARPEIVAARYFPAARVVAVPSGRAIAADEISLAPDDAAGLLTYLDTFAARGWRKALAFCDSRAEVEAYATAVRARSPFGDAVYVHYSNIEAKRRREVERLFTGAGAAILFATSTLELGIDIGDIDVVLLIGPPGSSASFLQRIGRGNRRGSITRVALFDRTPLERLLFAALRADPSPPTPSPAHGERGSGDDGAFRPSVAVQQIFSLLKGSPTGTVRLAELDLLFEGMAAPADLGAIVARLEELEYLAPGRPGEWRAGPRLNALIDNQGRPSCPRGIHSNIQSGGGPVLEVRDQGTGAVVARVDQQWLDRPVVTLEGRPVDIAWYDDEAMWVTPHRRGDPAARLRYRSARQLLSYRLAARLPAQLGLPPGTAPIVASPDGWWLFHWLGDVYGHALFDLLRYRIPASETAQPGICIHLDEAPRALPTWTAFQVRRHVEDNYRALEPMLALGPFHDLLPGRLRRAAVVAQFDVPRFLDAVADLRPTLALEELRGDLVELLRP